MQQNIINVVEEAITTAGGTDMRVQKLIHKTLTGLSEVQKIRVSVIVDYIKLNDFLTYMNEKFSNIKSSRLSVITYADNTPFTEEWEIEITFFGDESNTNTIES